MTFRVSIVALLLSAIPSAAVAQQPEPPAARRLSSNACSKRASVPRTSPPRYSTCCKPGRAHPRPSLLARNILSTLKAMVFVRGMGIGTRKELDNPSASARFVPSAVRLNLGTNARPGLQNSL